MGLHVWTVPSAPLEPCPNAPSLLNHLQGWSHIPLTSTHAARLTWKLKLMTQVSVWLTNSSTSSQATLLSLSMAAPLTFSITYLDLTRWMVQPSHSCVRIPAIHILLDRYSWSGLIFYPVYFPKNYSLKHSILKLKSYIFIIDLVVWWNWVTGARSHGIERPRKFLWPGSKMVSERVLGMERVVVTGKSGEKVRVIREN